MPVFTPVANLSASTNGKPIPIVATATPGTALHVVGAAGLEEIFLYVSNVTAAPATLTVEWGGVTDPGNHLVKGYSIPANSGPIPIALGLRMAGGVTIAAFSGTASALNALGYVNKVQ